MSALAEQCQREGDQIDAAQLEPLQLETKRRKLAQVIICDGCCCGRTDKGRPGIPLEHLKSEWKSRKLLGSVQLTISACLGPCDLANVVSVATVDGSCFFGKICNDAEYELLLDWATRCAAQNRLEGLPEVFSTRQFENFRQSESQPQPHHLESQPSAAALETRSNP